MADLDSRVFLELVTGVITPVNNNLTRHAEAIQTILAATQRIAEIVQTEPTRRSILEEMREELARLADECNAGLKEHDKQCATRGGQWNVEDVRRAEDVLRQAIDAIKDHFGKHQDQTECHLTPVKDMRDKFDKLIWAIVIACGLGVTMFGYLAWALSHLPVPGKP